MVLNFSKWEGKSMVLNIIYVESALVDMYAKCF